MQRSYYSRFQIHGDSSVCSDMSEVMQGWSPAHSSIADVHGKLCKLLPCNRVNESNLYEVR